MKKIISIPLIILFILVAVLCSAQDRGFKNISIDVEGETMELYGGSHALLIGVSDYTNGWPDLPGVKMDIEDVKRSLEEQGFNVVVSMNPNSNQLDAAFEDFINQYGMAVNNRLLIYFAGHGHTVKASWGDEMGYIVPVNAPLPDRNKNGFMKNAMSMQQMEVYAKQVQSKHCMFLFDACFSGSIFALSRAVPAAISYKTKKHVRQFITSGSADEQVPDESIFRKQFVTALTTDEADGNKDGYLTGTELGEYLQTTVVNYSYDAQHPQYGKIRHPALDKGDFVFILPEEEKAEVAYQPPVVETAVATQVTQPKPNESTPNPLAGPLPQRDYVLVRGGTFLMGSEEHISEYPPHNINVSSFYMLDHEITNREYADFLNSYGSDFVKYGPYKDKRMVYPYKRGVELKNGKWYPAKGCENLPVVYVTWYGANEFAIWAGGRLPTEAEYEFATQGGVKSKGYLYPGSDDFEKVAWFMDQAGTFGGKTFEIKTLQPNELGIYDLMGNVAEWCNDWYDKKYYTHSPTDNPQGPAEGKARAIRGGSVGSTAPLTRMSLRGSQKPKAIYKYLGFRIVKDL